MKSDGRTGIDGADRSRSGIWHARNGYKAVVDVLLVVGGIAGVAEPPAAAIKAMCETVLKELSPTFDSMYGPDGRHSLPPERLLKATVLMALYTVRSERQFCFGRCTASGCDAQGRADHSHGFALRHVGRGHGGGHRQPRLHGCDSDWVDSCPDGGCHGHHSAPLKAPS